jgi:hypothetical protein
MAPRVRIAVEGAAWARRLRSRAVPGPDIPGGVTAIAGAVRSFFGLTRHHRIREQLRDTVGLFAMVKEYPELKEAEADLAQVVKIQARRLRAVIEPERPPRKWEWGTFGVGAVCTLVLVAAEWWLWGYRAEWWAIVLLVLVGVVILVFLIVSLQALFQRQSAAA